MKLKLTPLKSQTVHVRRICSYIRHCRAAIVNDIELGLGKYHIVLRAIQLNPNKIFVLQVNPSVFEQVSGLITDYEVSNAILTDGSVHAFKCDTVIDMMANSIDIYNV